MKTTPPRKIVAVGEAMLEMSPAEVGLFRLDYAGDTFNTLWHAAQLLGPRADAGFVTRVGVIFPFLTGCIRRTYAAIFSFMAGVMPPMPMFGRSLLYVQSHCVA